MSEGSTRPDRSRSNRPRRRGGFFGSLWSQIVYYATAPMRWLSSRAENRRRQRESVGQTGGFWRRLSYPAYVVGQFFAGVMRWFGWWLKKANAKNLLYGLPAIIVALLAGVTSAVAYFKPTEKVVSWYERRANESLGYADMFKRDYEKSKSEEDKKSMDANFRTAKVCFERLVLLDPENKEYKFKLATAEEGVDERRIPRVWALMDELAPNDSQGYGRAHLWKANKLAVDKEMSLDKLRLMERHLLRSLNDLPPAEANAAHAVLVRYYLGTKQADQAMKHLADAVKAEPRLRVALGMDLIRRGQKERGLIEINQSKEYFKKKLEDNSADEDARMNLAQLLVFLEDFQGAEKVLSDGIRESNMEKYRPIMSSIYINWLDATRRQPKQDITQQIQLLQRAMKLDPKNPRVLNYLHELSRQDTPQAADLRKLIETMLASGQAPATMHLVLGMSAFSAGNYAEARKHLEIAYRQDPQLTEAANNLAWLYSHQEPMDLEKALNIATSVVNSAPTNGDYRDTRGEVLAKMGRFLDSLYDLEYALIQMPTNVGIHRNLEKSYRGLDMEGLADEHRRIADQLEQAQKAKQQASLPQVDPAKGAGPAEKPAGPGTPSTKDQPNSAPDEKSKDAIPKKNEATPAVNNATPEPTSKAPATPEAKTADPKPAETKKESAKKAG